MTCAALLWRLLTNTMKVWLLVCLVLFTCCLNVVFLEAIVKRSPSAGNLVTFAQFLFISLEGIAFTANFGRRKPNIPLRKYVLLVICFFAVNVSNNLALSFQVSVPLHIIFRSGSLLANLVLGVVILSRRYSLRKYLSVLLITIGIIAATLASATPTASAAPPSRDFAVGIALLSFALVMSARLGIFQEVLFQTHGKHPKEAVFYQHFLALPGFVLMLPDICSQAKLFSQSEPWLLGVPALWVLLAVNTWCQYLCIQSVMRLMSECTSLTVTLVLTLRKFLSLLFSIFYFDNPFTATHWSATVLVFAGTLLFIELPNKDHVITVDARLRRARVDDKRSDKSSEEEDE